MAAWGRIAQAIAGCRRGCAAGPNPSRRPCRAQEKAFDEAGRLRQPKALSINKIGHAMHDLDATFRAYSRSDKMAAAMRALGFRRPVPVQSMVGRGGGWAPRKAGEGMPAAAPTSGPSCSHRGTGRPLTPAACAPRALSTTLGLCFAFNGQARCPNAQRRRPHPRPPRSTSTSSRTLAARSCRTRTRPSCEIARRGHI
jgi:hypothetical protein